MILTNRPVRAGLRSFMLVFMLVFTGVGTRGTRTPTSE